MLKVKIKLKTNVKPLLEEFEENQKHTDYIEFTPAIEALLGTTIEAEIDYNNPDDEDPLPTDGVVFYPMDSGTMIHYKWVSAINGVDIEPTVTANNEVFKITKDHYLQKSTNTLIHKDDITICTNCGGVLDDEDEDTCSTCIAEKFFNLHNYSYKPTFNFHGKQVGELNKTNPAWYGIELEYGLKSKSKMAKLVKAHSSEVFLKQDSSISGGDYTAELVSHPCSFSYLKSEDSWLNKIDTLDAVDKPKSNGCHIHVSRTAFKDDRHYAKFKYLIQSNIPLLEAIGGRQLTDFCQTSAPKGKIHTTKKDTVGGQRKRVCNEANSDTIELRFMASTKKSKQALRYLEFLDSMIKYTGYHTNSASFVGYNKYVTKYVRKYENIKSFLAQHEAELAGKVVYKEPTVVTVKLPDISIEQLASAFELALTNGKTMTLDPNYNVEIRDGEVTAVHGYRLSEIDTISYYKA